MNYLSHARELLDRPYAVAGTALPDWIAAFDRDSRLRSGGVLPEMADDGSPRSEILSGIERHFHDDAWFHGTAAFRNTVAEMARGIRARFPDLPRRRVRATFIAHLMLEMLLDGALMEADPALLPAYRETLGRVELRVVADVAGELAPIDPDAFHSLLQRFKGARIFDVYLSDVELTARLDAILVRARQSPLPEGFIDMVTEARPLIASRAKVLLTPP